MRLGRKLLLFALCLLLVLGQVGICSAATYQITEQEYSRLMENSNRLERIIEVLGQNSSLSQKQLLEVEAKLAKVEQQLLQSENALKQTDALLKKQDASIEKANSFLETYAKEQKAIQASLRREKTVWQVISGIAVGALIWQAAKR